MARFLTELMVSIQDDEFADLISSLIYETDIRIPNYYPAFVVHVPAGFKTDFESVKRLPIVFMFAKGVARRPSVVHDFLYKYGIGTKAVADKIFLEAMEL